MYDDRSQLSPDLEWMLSGVQASPAEVYAAVAREHAAFLYRIAVSLLGDPQDAEEALREVLIAVPTNRHRFSAKLGVRNWLCVLMIEGCRRYHRGRKLRLAYKKQRQSGIGARTNTAQESRNAEVDWQVRAALDGLSERYRLPLLLKYTHGMPAEDIALIVRLPVARLQPVLRQAGQELYRRLGPRFWQLWVSEDQDSAGCGSELEWAELESLLERLLSTGSFTPEEIPRPADLLLRFEEPLEQHQQQRQKLFTAHQLVFLVAMVALVLVAGWTTNLLFPRSAAHLPQILQVTQPVKVPVLVTQVVTTTPLPPAQALNESSAPYEISQRLVESSQSWESLWADALIIRYGPAGYIGPPQIYRNQVWVRQPDQIMALTGPPTGSPDYVSFNLYGHIYEMDLRNRQTYYYREGDGSTQRLFGPSPAFAGMNDDPLRGLIEGSYIKPLIFPTHFGHSAQGLRMVGNDSLSTGQALVVEAGLDDNILGSWLGRVVVEDPIIVRYRLWLDPQTGLILRWMRFDPADPTTVTEEVVLTRLVLGVPFPEQSYSSYFFSPERFNWENEWRPDGKIEKPPGLAWAPPFGRTLSEEAPGRGSDQPVLIPPSAVRQANLPNARLVFRWDFHWDRGGGEDSGTGLLVPGSKANIFAGRYYLGRYELGNPWQLTCERSPDGRLLAFSEGGMYPFRPVLKSGWLDLTRPRETYSLLPEGSQANSDVAFSPDSRSLAFWGCDNTDDSCGVYVQDLATHENRRLAASSSSAFFTWSPDGEYLAMLRLLEPAGGSDPSPRIIVLRVSNGEIVYEGDYDWQANRIAENSPTLTWEVSFPPSPTGLEGCIAAPGGSSR